MAKPGDIRRRLGLTRTIKPKRSVEKVGIEGGGDTQSRSDDEEFDPVLHDKKTDVKKS